MHVVLTPLLVHPATPRCSQHGGRNEGSHSAPSDPNRKLIIKLSNNDGHGKRHHHPPRTVTQASHTLSDMFSRLGCEMNEFQSTTQTPRTCAAALATVE